MNKRTAGTLGEAAACQALQRAGVAILERNFRRPTGEIDIVAREDKSILFIEVNARLSMKYGRPAEAVNRTKQLRIVRTAMQYLAEHGLSDVPVRFDVIEVLPGEVRHLRAAFDATDLL